MNPRLKPLAAILPALFAISANAQQLAQLDPVVVTATRFNEHELSTAANITTISQEDIRESGAQTLPDILKYVAGLEVRPLYGSIGADTAIDMRGFGEGAGQRTLVLLNGQRLNPLDTSNVDWGLVPLDSIDRVEIVSGSAAILYGDNAVGGVINIITGQPRDGANLQVGIGSNNGQQISTSIGKNWGPVALALSANHQATDGWRQNNNQERNNLSGRLGTRFEGGEAFVDLGWSSVDLGLPGSLTRAQYETSPRQAETRDSFAERRAAFVRPGGHWQINETLKVAAELAYSEMESTSWISNFPSYDSRKTNTVSITPRVLWQHGLGSLDSKSTLGVDLYDGELTSDKSASNAGPITKTVSINQTSQAVYFQNQTRLSTDLTLTAGARHQQIDQSAKDTSGLSLSNDYRKTIKELGLSYKFAPGLRIFSRFGSTFRFANLDELTTFVGFVSKPVRPEHGTVLDLGGQWSGPGYSLKVTAYTLKMTDEIAFNGSTFENENIAKTRHQGIEANASYDVDRHWQINGGINLQNAEFIEGADNGKKIPLVPAIQATAGLSYKPTAEWNLSLRANHVGERYFGGDTSNQRDKLAAYTTADFVVSWHQSAWTVRARMLNLTDKKYAHSGFDFGFGASYYPADGRTVFADLRYDF